MPPEQGRTGFFLGRQALFDRNRAVVGYELLFRDSEKNSATFLEASAATASVIVNALNRFGLHAAIGNSCGFINVGREMLFSSCLDFLPPERLCLELLESVELDDTVVRRCRELKARGFCIALDDHRYSPVHAEIYSLIDIIKIDISVTSPQEVARLSHALRTVPVRLLAEKVETAEELALCIKLGFHLFQGGYLQPSQVLKQKGLTLSRYELLQLSDRLHDHDELHLTEQIFRNSLPLSLQLLSLVNSLSTSDPQIGSISQAIAILGIDRLRHWVQLSLMATDSRGFYNPLLEMAMSRARIMQDLMIRRRGPSREKDLTESAFMTGMLSLMDVVFETPMYKVIARLGLNDAVSAALLSRQGELGRLLSLVEMQEMNTLDATEETPTEESVTRSNLLGAQLHAINWRAMTAA